MSGREPLSDRKAHRCYKCGETWECVIHANCKGDGTVSICPECVTEDGKRILREHLHLLNFDTDGVAHAYRKD